MHGFVRERVGRVWISCILGCVLSIFLSGQAWAAEEQDIERLKTFFHDQIWNGISPIVIDGRQYGNPSMTEISNAFQSMYQLPDMFLLEGGRPFQVIGYLTRYEITPPYHAQILREYDSAKQLYLREIQTIVSYVDAHWSDLQKVLFVHDYLALHYAYDESWERNDVYSFFQDHTGTCTSYSLAMTAILEELGIACSYVQSDSMNHRWNIVNIDGDWYHLDVTWDDPTPDHVGTVRHTYFLLSTSRIKTIEEGQHVARDDWNFGQTVSCASTKYDFFFWQDAISPFAVTEESWYFVDNQGLNVWDGISSSAAQLVSFEQLFQQWYPNYRFYGYTTGRSVLYLVHDLLYFNTAYHILAYHVPSGSVSQIADHINTDGAIVDHIALMEDQLVYDVVQTDKQDTRYAYTIPDYEPTSEVDEIDIDLESLQTDRSRDDSDAVVYPPEELPPTTSPTAPTTKQAIPQILAAILGGAAQIWNWALNWAWSRGIPTIQIVIGIALLLSVLFLLIIRKK